MTPQTLPTQREILALETAYWDAVKSKDGDRTAALSGDPAVVTGARGVISIPRAKMAKMTEEGNWSLESYSLEDIEFSAPAPDVAILAYTVTQAVTMKGETRTFRAADSSTWVRGSDGWVCHAHSETLLGDGKTA